VAVPPLSPAVQVVALRLVTARRVLVLAAQEQQVKGTPAAPITVLVGREVTAAVAAVVPVVLAATLMVRLVLAHHRQSAAQM